MCGIAGFCNIKDNWDKIIKNMNQVIYHRGPDAEGIWNECDNSVVLGHRRLSIIDLSETGSQPMESKSGRFVIAFNGEIYNYKVIVKKLLAENKVSSFRGTSDTEVLLEAFENYGIDETLDMIKGMFAIALYDRVGKKLYLMRDRIGEKPLYYGFINGTFAFASEISCFCQIPRFNQEIDRSALKIYFQHGYIPAPYSIYKDIKKLDAGKYLELDFPYEACKIKTYWSVCDVALKGQKHMFTGSFEEATEELKRLLLESVSLQMVADVPVGAFLSGGIDSSTTVALMQSLSKNQVKTFTIGFHESQYNEAEIAKKIAKHLGTDHTELYVTDREAKDVIPMLSSMYGEPFADSSQIPTYLVSKLARERVTVSLSGDGGDELFCGYNSYRRIAEKYALLEKLAYTFRKYLGCILGNGSFGENSRINLCGRLMQSRSVEELYRRVFNSTRLIDRLVLNATDYPFKYTEYQVGFLPAPQSNLMLMDLLMYHPDDILVKVDRAAMANSLETRIPMLDKDVVEFAWTLPLEYKYNGENAKRVLKNVLYQYVPEKLLLGKKSGFSIPILQWIRNGELKQWAEDLLDTAVIRQQGLLDADVVARLWKDFLKTGSNGSRIWYILMFQQWLIKDRVL